MTVSQSHSHTSPLPSTPSSRSSELRMKLTNSHQSANPQFTSSADSPASNAGTEDNDWTMAQLMILAGSSIPQSRGSEIRRRPGVVPGVLGGTTYSVGTSVRTNREGYVWWPTSPGHQQTPEQRRNNVMGRAFWPLPTSTAALCIGSTDCTVQYCTVTWSHNTRMPWLPKVPFAPLPSRSLSLPRQPQHVDINRCLTCPCSVPNQFPIPIPNPQWPPVDACHWPMATRAVHAQTHTTPRGDGARPLNPRRGPTAQTSPS
ncbi:hypothetical protein BJ875DRAFT_453164 [Amylocarpus encephaloides]|uniref:Uncharacterized protein n=1 Tax=Amylocarpus encephaloides TaxID=45428 RepID=A0A9P7YPN9_9HELO|nr:hypothetical protein BJ875DRAFT_453164 [Amylocarpus encephaloides]